MHKKIRELHKQVASDPKNPYARVQLLLQKSRVEGPHVLTAPVFDFRVWTKISATVQDLAIHEIARSLGHQFKWEATKVYECAQAGWEQLRIATFRHIPTSIELNLIPGGYYKPRICLDHATPSDQSSYIKPFLIGRFPVTQKQWDRLSGRDDRLAFSPTLPITEIGPPSYIKLWLERARDGIRLPSEIEWEYASYTHLDTKYYWGNCVNDLFCWHEGNSSGKIQSVLAHRNKTNVFGLSDSFGLVFERCLLDSNLARITDNNVIRGGAYNRPANTFETRLEYEHRSSEAIGFRVSRSLDVRLT